MTRATMFRFMKKTGIATAALLFALGLGLAILLGTAGGRQMLLDFAAASTAAEDFHLTARGLTLGQEWSLDALRLSDAKGVWLELEHIRLRPRLGALLLARVDLERFGIARTVLHRLPASEEDADTEISMPSLPPVNVMSLSLDRIELRREALGQPAELSVNGTMNLNGDGGRANLSIIRLDRPRDMLHMAASFRGQPKRLDLDVRAHEAPDGLLHTLLDLNRLSGENSTQGISLTLHGQGDPSHWPLAVSLRLASAFSLDANATLKADDREASLHGRISLGAAMREVVRLADPDIDLAAHAFWTDEELHLSNLRVENAAGVLSGNGTWNPADDELLAAFRLVAGDIAPLLPADVAPGPAALTGELRSTARDLRLDAYLDARDWTTSGHRLRSAGLNASLAHAFGGEWNFRTAFALHAPDLPPGLQTIAGNAAGAGRGHAWRLDDLSAQSPAVSLRAHGKADSAVSGNATVTWRDLILGEYVLSGRMAASATGSPDPDGSTFRARLALNADGISGLPPELLHLTGKTPELRAAVSIAPDMLRMDSLDLRGNTRLTGNATFRPDTRAFSGAFNAVLPELQSADLHVPAGPVIRGQGHGNSTDLDFSFEAHAPTLLAGPIQIGNATASAKITGLSQPAYTLRAQATAAGEPVALTARATVDYPAVHLQNATLTLPRNTLAIDGKLDTDSLIFQGRGRFDSADLSPLGRLAGQDMGGTLSLRTDFFAEEDRQSLRIKGDGANLVMAEARIADAALSGNLTLTGSSPRMDMALSLGNIVRDDMRLDRFRLRARGSDKETDIAFELHQNATRSAVTGKGRVAADASRIHAVLSSLEGTLLGQKLRLAAPVDIAHEPERTTWTRGTLRFGPATLSTSGEITPAAMDIAARLENMNPALLGTLWPGLPQGHVEAALTVAGSAERPDARLDVRGRDILLTDSGQNRLSAMDVSGNATLQQGRLESALTVNGQRGAASANAKISLPVQGVMPALRIADDAPLAGRVQGILDLALLPRLMMLDAQTLAGKAEMDILLGGTASAPAMSGTARVSGGRYENHISGTRLESVSATATLSDTEARFVLNATDGREGTLSARGSADLRRLSHASDIRLNQCEVVNTDLIRGRMGGHLHIQGQGGAMAVNGTLVPDPTYVSLPSDISGVTRIEVEEINVPGENGTALRKEDAAMPVQLQVRLDIPARLFVRGRGLDSEWSGHLDISGPQSNPAVRGHMNLLRGRFEFLDRVFDLTKGSVSLGGETPPNPFLDVQGECRIAETLIQVRLNGPARNFRLTLSSTPSLPQDELLSMILFGRSLSDISPLQAVRLAQAAATLTGVKALTGASEGLNILSSLKSRLGLQEVDISRDHDGDAALELGGYVGGKYYVRTQSSIAGQDSTRIEIQITPKISVETEIGADSRQGGGINWRKDY